MTLKIIKHTEEVEKSDSSKTFSFNVEELLRKTFFLCSKVVDFANEVLDCTDFKSIITAPTDEIFEEKFIKLQRAMSVFSLMFGKKVSIADALTKATTTMKNLQILAQKFDVHLISDEADADAPLSNEDVDIMVEMMKDFGAETIKQEIETYNENLKIEALKKKEEKTEKIDVYDVYEDDG